MLEWQYDPQYGIVAGVDEAGRGCLSGPVVAAAVILPQDWFTALLNDSKQVKESQRLILETEIKANALAWAVGVASPREIEEVNILRATYLAMHRAINLLKIKADTLFIDGNRFNKLADFQHLCHIKGDGRFACIAAASILAKTERDRIMQELHLEFPHYNWSQNKGYPTLDHRQAIRNHGDCIHHRKTFNLLPPNKQLELF